MIFLEILSTYSTTKWCIRCRCLIRRNNKTFSNMKIILFIWGKFFQTFFTLKTKEKANSNKWFSQNNELVMNNYSFLRDKLNVHDSFVYAEIYFCINDTRVYRWMRDWFYYWNKRFTLNGCVPTWLRRCRRNNWSRIRGLSVSLDEIRD